VVGHDKQAGKLEFGVGGFQGGRNWHTGRSGPTKDKLISGGWYVENVLAELDVENEWYYDRKAGKLYLYPNSTGYGSGGGGSGGPDGADLVATHLQTLISIKGTMASPVKGITIQGVGFRDAAYTYLEPWGVPSGGVSHSAAYPHSYTTCSCVTLVCALAGLVPSSRGCRLRRRGGGCRGAG
jgi:hypothetical protein